MKEEDLLHLLEDMPDEVDAEQVIYRVYLREKIDRAEAARRRRRGCSPRRG